MMNLCLEKQCRNGFAYHLVYQAQFDFSGSFRYFCYVYAMNMMDKTRSFEHVYVYACIRSSYYWFAINLSGYGRQWN